jgi:hypothetical protein
LPALVLELILVVVAVALAAAAETIDLGDEENQDHGIARLEISNHA